ncbi:MAG: YraN family protein [Microbacteriaceae bacterium]|nr:YraN family protein [Microbacteriaceae bacterium]
MTQITTSSVTTQPPPAHHNQRIGAQGEHLATRYLEAQGYVLLAQNWRFGRLGELDLVMQHRGVVIGIEVKTRSGSGFGNPLESITPQKASRLRKLLLAWVHGHQPGARSLRIDAVGVTLQGDADPTIEHLRGIW